MAAEAARLSLDPFGFWPRYASRIAGLGGNEPPEEASYAFHSDYAYSSGGPMRFRLSFEGLTASAGALAIRIHREVAGGAGRIDVAYRQSFPLSQISQTGEVVVEVPTSAGDSCAVIGAIEGDGHPSAAAIRLDVERYLDAAVQSRRLAEGRARIFAPKRLRKLAPLVSMAPATLADPVSQLCTSAQFAEPDYMKWVERMALGGLHMHRKQWEFVYILQALEHYGMLREGARGLGFGVGRERLPAVLASMGCTILSTDLPSDHDVARIWHVGQQHSQNLDGLRFPEICDEAIFAKRVSFRPVDMNAIPGDIVDYDFAWSSCAFEHLGSIPAGLRFVERSLDCVRPGGLVVHTTELNLSSNAVTVDRGETVLFRRRDMEALARRLTALGHEVAPLKYDAGDGYADNYVDVPPYTGDAQLKIALGGHLTTSFGIIVRKALRPRSPLARLFRR